MIPKAPTKAEAELGNLLNLNDTFVAAAAYPEEKIAEMTVSAHKGQKISKYVAVPFSALAALAFFGSMWKDPKTHEAYPPVTAVFMIGLLGWVGSNALDKSKRLSREIEEKGTENLLTLYKQSISENPAP